MGPTKQLLALDFCLRNFNVVHYGRLTKHYYIVLREFTLFPWEFCSLVLDKQWKHCILSTATQKQHGLEIVMHSSQNIGNVIVRFHFRIGQLIKINTYLPVTTDWGKKWDIVRTGFLCGFRYRNWWKFKQWSNRSANRKQNHQRLRRK